MADNKNDFSATTPARRFLKLAGMTTGIATRIASNQVKNLFASEEAKEQERLALYADVGAKIAETLGEMKGAVMKVGQIASQLKEVFPAPIAEALSKLQKESPPMPYAVIEQQIRRELGDTPDQLFAHFEREPFAAASIGQVHRARLKSGEDVVVKVQYPGVDECCESDLKQLRTALKLAGVLKIDRKIQDALFAEIRDSLLAELNYRQEADNLREFATVHADDDGIVIPRVFESYTARRVLTLSYEPGDHVSAVRTPAYDQDTINRLGHRLFNALSHQLWDHHALHCDSHAGNFAFRPDGTVIIYDFGCIKRLSPELVQTLRGIIGSALNQDYSALERHLRTVGLRREDDQRLPADFYARWCDTLLWPFRTEQPFDFGHSRMHDHVISQLRGSLKYWDAFQPSADMMLVNRTLGGHYWNLVQLGVNTAFRPNLLAHVH